MEENTKTRLITFCKNALITRERDKDKTEYVCFNEETEFKPYWEEIKNILYKSGFEIQDFYYRTLEEALYSVGQALSSTDDLNDLDLSEYIEADIYTDDLLKWVEEGANYSYCDEALNELGIPKDNVFISILQQGQYMHKEEIYNIAIKVIKYLEEEFNNENEKEQKALNTLEGGL